MEKLQEKRKYDKFEIKIRREISQNTNEISKAVKRALKWHYYNMSDFPLVGIRVKIFDSTEDFIQRTAEIIKEECGEHIYVNIHHINNGRYCGKVTY